MDKYANATEFAGPITLTADIGTDDTSIAFTGTIPASLRNGTSRWRCGNELVIATINSGGTSPMTWERGAEDSTKATHAAGTRFTHKLTAAQFTAVQDGGTADGTTFEPAADLESTDVQAALEEEAGRRQVVESGGLVIVAHGSDANAARARPNGSGIPPSGAALWIGSVAPTNAIDGDLRIQT